MVSGGAGGLGDRSAEGGDGTGGSRIYKHEELLTERGTGRKK